MLFYTTYSYNRYKQKRDEELLMGKIQIDSGRSSAATHRLTQASTTLNRRYVRRPSNIAVDEAAHAATFRDQATNTPRVAPSRLVNLRVHTADLEKAKASAAKSESITPEIEEPTNDEMPVIMTPNIVEFGRPAESTNETSDNISPVQTSYTQPETDETITSIAHDAAEIANTEPPAESTKAPEEIDTAALAASIAADYAATSLGMSIKEFGNGHDDYAMSEPNGETIAEQQADAEAGIETVEPSSSMMSNGDSVEAIALAASNAIASIREATEPDQVSEQVASLKAFAENIKSSPAMPEMRELGDTIDKFVNIAMKSSNVKEENERKVAAKVALSPKVTRAAAKVTKSSAKVMAANSRTKARAANTPMNTVAMRRTTMPANNMQTVARPQMRRRSSPQELKASAIESALASVATMEDRGIKPRTKKSIPRKKTGAKRFAIALTCAVACVIAVIGFVGANIPDISVRVAAMQTGIQASYPSYTPRDYSLGDISSENGKITMVFNGPDNSSFKLIEEKSSWDSSALLRNYVEPSWGEEYATTHEQGITIYISNASSDAAWVNGGVLYKITSEGTSLTKKQVRSIVTSL